MADLKTFLAKLHKNLNTLREREAKHGGNAPLELLNQITDHEQAIALTEQAIEDEISEAEWREALEPLLVEIDKRGKVQEICQVNIGDVSEVDGRQVVLSM